MRVETVQEYMARGGEITKVGEKEHGYSNIYSFTYRTHWKPAQVEWKPSVVGDHGGKSKGFQCDCGGKVGVGKECWAAYSTNGKCVKRVCSKKCSEEWSRGFVKEG